jgi:hypothetical protein
MDNKLLGKNCQHKKSCAIVPCNIENGKVPSKTRSSFLLGILKFFLFKQTGKGCKVVFLPDVVN